MLTREKIEYHISYLEEKHRKIDEDIDVLYNQHGNDLKIETLKKIKLHIKDEIEQFKSKAKLL
jgi:hypothetical protein